MYEGHSRNRSNLKTFKKWFPMNVNLVLFKFDLLQTLLKSRKNICLEAFQNGGKPIQSACYEEQTMWNLQGIEGC